MLRADFGVFATFPFETVKEKPPKNRMPHKEPNRQGVDSYLPLEFLQEIPSGLSIKAPLQRLCNRALEVASHEEVGCDLDQR